MSSGNRPDPAAIRAKLNHPVIDSDGHWLEFGPVISEYLERVGGRSLVEAFNSRNDKVVRDLKLTLEERRDTRRPQQAWWAFPTKNTLDRATATLPRLLNERLDELGLDFTVLYPTTGLAVPFIGNDEVRRASCRAFNMYVADLFKEYADRMTPAGVIPMGTPQEAIDELEYASKTLGLKVVVMASVLKRPIPATARRSPELARHSTWLDMLGLDSAHDYDPVWAKCVELGIAPTFHSSGRGYGMRVSVSNFTYNHIGHFAVAGEAICKALFLGGVTRRFPTLKFAFLEGGVGWASNLYADLIGHWKKRNARALAEVDPENLDRKRLAELFDRYGGPAWSEKLRQWTPDGEGAVPGMPGVRVYDDYAACGIERPQDIRDLFCTNFYFGCESDDPMNVWGFNRQVNPYGARLKMLFGSDIGHFDVPDMREVLPEAHELVDDGLITEQDFRDFVFGYPVEFWGGMNPEFFKGTRVEQAATAWLAQNAAQPAEPRAAE
jgi:predicted TIM-barrel fold metal-dependent hydrolase